MIAMKSLSEWIDPAFRKLLYTVDTADRQDGKPFDRPHMLLPHTDSKRYGWTHYGLMIPDLPAPHRYFSIMSIIGTPGAQCFDIDYARRDTPRRNATVVSGTAATHPAHFGAYAIGKQGEFSADGRLIRFGKEVVIRGGYPEYHVQAAIGGYEIELQVLNTDKVSWFIKNPVYEHISLLSEYRGMICGPSGSITVSGLCAFEYGACISPYVLRDKPLDWQRKVPLDFFFYNIINVDKDTQLLLSYCTMKGLSVNRSVLIRGRNRYTQTLRAVDVVVDEYHPQPAVSPDGIVMKLPAVWRWQARDGGKLVVDLRMTQDTPFTYGLGNGYVGGGRFEGEFEGQPVRGGCYVEYIDVRGVEYP